MSSSENGDDPQFEEKSYEYVSAGWYNLAFLLVSFVKLVPAVLCRTVCTSSMKGSQGEEVKDGGEDGCQPKPLKGEFQ